MFHWYMLISKLLDLISILKFPFQRIAFHTNMHIPDDYSDVLSHYYVIMWNMDSKYVGMFAVFCIFHHWTKHVHVEIFLTPISLFWYFVYYCNAATLACVLGVIWSFGLDVTWLLLTNHKQM